MSEEDQGKSDKKEEDLFEDLDKFFAPIQDVDWPETVSEEEEPAAPTSPASAPDEPPEERIELPDLAGIVGDLDADALDEPKPETPGQAGLFLGEAPEEEAGEAEEIQEADWPTAEDTGETLMYDTEPEISVESLSAAPPEYEDLPGPGEDEEDTVAAPLDEGPIEPEEEPTPEAVEAAAEHFAESVRLEEDQQPEIATEVETGPFDLPGPGEVEEELLADLEQSTTPRTVKVGGAEELGGPSWQEPSSVEVGGEPEQGGGPRDVPAAFLTGAVLAALAVGSIAIGAGPFAIVAGAVVLLGQGELYAAMHKRHFQPATALGLVSGALVLAAAYFKGEAAMLAMLALGVFATFLWYMATPAAHRKHTIANVGATILGIVYAPVLAGYALALLKLPDGRALTLSVIGLSFAYDTAAFVVGYFWGSRPLAQTISPKKSWEGAIGATLVVIAVSVGIVASSVDLLNSVGDSVGLAVVVAVFAPLGDLAESLLKRDLGVKDMGSILPGHGGVLDRIDSVLFVAPAAFMFLRLILL